MTSSPFLPKVEIVIEESSSGWVGGLNVNCNSTSGSYVYIKDIDNVIYNSLFSTSGVNVFFSHLSYVSKSSLSGTFSGEVKDASSNPRVITHGSFNLSFAN